MSRWVERVPRHIYEARLRNAHRVWQAFQVMRADGMLIFDENGELVAGEFKIDEEGSCVISYESARGGVHMLYFAAEPTLDNGAFETIEQFTSQFDAWTFIYPSQRRALRSMLDFNMGKEAA